MKFKRTCYIVFIFILCTIFSSEVKAMEGEGGTGSGGVASTMSCVYYDNKDVYKLVQDNNGKLYLYYPASATKDSVIINGSVSWSGAWNELNRNIYLFGGFVQNPVQGFDISGNVREKYLTSCPKTLIASEWKVGTVYISERKDISIDDVKKASYKLFELKDSVAEAHITNSEKINANEHKKFNNKCDDISIADMWLDSATKESSHASCLYSYDLKDNKGCMVLQLNIDESGAVSPLVGLPSNLGGYQSHGSISAFNDYYIRNQYNGNCPMVYVSTHNQKADFGYSLAFDLPNKNEWYTMKNRAFVGKNLNDPTLDISDYKYKGFEFGFIDMTGMSFSCSDLLDEDGELIELLHMLLVMVKIIVPIIIIVLGSLDFINAMFAGDESVMKKAQAKFIKRLVIGVAIFLVPSMLKLLLSIGHSVWPVIDADLCGIL